jgi:hypothetical protein
MGIDYEARVAKGIALLDEKIPDWVDRIDLDTLDIGNGNHCVTAQLSSVGDWIPGMQMLGLEAGDHHTGSYTEHGFNTESFYDVADYKPWEARDTLTEIWKRRITERRQQATTPA